MGDRDRFFSSDYKETGVTTCLWISEPSATDKSVDTIFCDFVSQFQSIYNHVFQEYSRKVQWECLCCLQGPLYPGFTTLQQHGTAVWPKQKTGSDQPADPPQCSNLVSRWKINESKWNLKCTIGYHTLYELLTCMISVIFTPSPPILAWCATWRVWLGSWG